tara:strand:- start:218 stop:493 length:276 start_codon:yes stop_codon:yes gene_type:complete
VFSAVGISTCALAQDLIDKISKDGHIHRSVTDRDRRLIDEILRLVREGAPRDDDEHGITTAAAAPCPIDIHSIDVWYHHVARHQIVRAFLQ